MKRVIARQKAVDLTEISALDTKQVTGGTFQRINPIGRLPGVVNPIGRLPGGPIIVTLAYNEEELTNPQF